MPDQRVVELCWWPRLALEVWGFYFYCHDQCHLDTWSWWYQDLNFCWISISSNYCSEDNKLFEELCALVHSRAQVDNIIRSESSSVAFFVYLVSFESLRCRLRLRNGTHTDRIELNMLVMFTLCRWPRGCAHNQTQTPGWAELVICWVWDHGKSNGQLSAGIWREREVYRV